MTPVGENLRRERLKRNLELEEISRELKISMRFLQAIENDQYDKLPGGVFAKSFARQYARLLGLDEEDIAGQVQQVVGPVEVPQPVETPKPMAFSSIHVPKVDEWQTVGDRRFHWSGWLSAVVVGGRDAGLFGGLRLAAASQGDRDRACQSSGGERAATGRTAKRAAGHPTGRGFQYAGGCGRPARCTNRPTRCGASTGRASADRSTSGPWNRSRRSQSRQPAVGQITPANPEATVHVEINADEAVWVLARADGKYAFSATMDPHTTRTVEGVKQVMVRLGNAGGVTISLNGKPIGPAGPKGQVRTIQFTSGGFQIVPAKGPVLDPLDRF